MQQSTYSTFIERRGHLFVPSLLLILHAVS